MSWAYSQDPLEAKSLEHLWAMGLIFKSAWWLLLTPLKNMKVSQLRWLFPIDGKKMFQTTSQK